MQKFRNQESPEKPLNPRSQAEWYEPPEQNIVVSYFLSTAIHGLQYLGKPKLHICERLLWLTAFIAASTTGAILITQIWQRYQTLPIITVLNPSALSLNDIPFPAVTICNVNDVKKSKVDELIRNIEEVERTYQVTNETLNQAYAAAYDIKRICDTSRTFTSRFYTPKIRQDFLKKLLGETLAKRIQQARKRSGGFSQYRDPIKLLMEGSQKCDEMILLCVWSDQIRNCNEIFQQIVTDFGVCCTFNMMPHTLLRRWLAVNDTTIPHKNIAEWKKDPLSMAKLIFTDETRNRPYPRRQVHPGRSSGLSILLDPNLDDYFCPNMDSEGFVMSLHTSLDIPKIRETGIVIGANSEVLVGVRPEITIYDESIKSFTAKQRHCYLRREKKLAHYTKYTETNCIDECVANLTKSKCQCVHYFMPRGPSDDLCIVDDFNCTDAVSRNITREGLGKACESCLPTCTEISYVPEMATQHTRKKSVDRLLEVHPQFKNDTKKKKDLSIIHIYFNEDGTYPRLRKEQFGMVDLLSNSGGLLGLCLGFSGLSLLEIIYYFTIRVLFRYYRKQSVEPKDAIEDVDNDSQQLNMFLKDKSHYDHDIRRRQISRTGKPIANEDILFKTLHKSNGNTTQNYSNEKLFHSEFKSPYLNFTPM